jgi:hypothetical protein
MTVTVGYDVNVFFNQPPGRSPKSCETRSLARLLSNPAASATSPEARLNRLGLPAKHAAQTGAAIPRVRNRAAGIRYGLAGPQLHEALDRLKNADLLFVRAKPPEVIYVFRHVRMQDASYGTLLRSRRQRLHGRVVATLEDRFPETVLAHPALLTEHCAEAGVSISGDAGRKSTPPAGQVGAGSAML